MESKESDDSSPRRAGNRHKNSVWTEAAVPTEKWRSPEEDWVVLCQRRRKKAGQKVAGPGEVAWRKTSKTLSSQPKFNRSLPSTGDELCVNLCCQFVGVWMRLMHRTFRWTGLTTRGQAEVGLRVPSFQKVDESLFSLVFLLVFQRKCFSVLWGSLLIARAACKNRRRRSSGRLQQRSTKTVS